MALRCHIDWMCCLQLWWPFQRSWHIKKARETRITACRSLSQNARPAAGMSTRQIPPQLTYGATLPYRLNVLHVIVVTFSTIVAYPKSQKTCITACRLLSQNAQPAAGMSTRQNPPQLTHGATLPYRLNVLHVIVVTFSTIVAYQ